MRAARWHARQDVRIDEVAEPSTAAPGEVILAVDLAMICASDLAEWRSGPHVIRDGRPHPITGVTSPVTLGHEFVGRVIATGEGSGLDVGARVCADACVRCHQCFWCLRGEYNICEAGGSVGYHIDGGFAPLVRLPSYLLHAVPESVTDREAAVVEPLAVGLHALRRGRFQAGESVVIVGYGMVGASVAALALALGAGAVIVVEPSPIRAALAGSAGATEVLDPTADDVRRSVRGLTSGRGADVVVECTGNSSVMPQAIDMSRRGGRIVIAGISHDPAQIVGDRLVYFEREVIGALGYRFDHPAIIDLLSSRRLDVAHLFADEIPLTRIVPDGLQRMADDPSVPLRIPVLPGEE